MIRRWRNRRDAITLLPLAHYHAVELSQIAEQLEALGERTRMLVPAADADHIAPGLGGRRFDSWLPDTIPASLNATSALVAMNDWGPSKTLFGWCAERGVPTFGKVEGVQDFDDVDTPAIRNPYRHARHVLGQGSNDVEGLPGVDVHVVGNSQLESLWRATERPISAPRSRVVINSNFTYGVLLEHRETFLDQAVNACAACALEPVISRHPADTLLPERFRPLIADRAMSDLLDRQSMLVTRFSTVMYEAMAKGVPVAYFNPHGEHVPVVDRCGSAISASDDVASLADSLRTMRAGIIDQSAVDRAFRAQVDMTSEPSARRAAEVIHRLVSEGAPS